jgi:hypothetical protein
MTGTQGHEIRRAITWNLLLWTAASFLSGKCHDWVSPIASRTATDPLDTEFCILFAWKFQIITYFIPPAVMCWWSLWRAITSGHCYLWWQSWFSALWVYEVSVIFIRTSLILVILVLVLLELRHWLPWKFCCRVFSAISHVYKLQAHFQRDIKSQLTTFGRHMQLWT